MVQSLHVRQASELAEKGRRGEWLHKLHHRDPRDYSGKDKLSDVTRDYDQVWGARKYS